MIGHRAKKRFGQHFLTADETVQRIVDAISPRAGERLVEIGPGKAAITRPLAKTFCELHAIEFDRDLVESLRKGFQHDAHVSIHEADALQFDFRQLGDSLRVVGNLPYNISTPLLFHLLQYSDVIDDMHFMLQKEVVDRMAAEPGNKNYGRLTIMLGCQLDIVPLFDVPPEAFSPAPRVSSAVVRLRPNLSRRSQIKNRTGLESLVRLAFSRRRKTLRNALAGMAGESLLKPLGIDPSLRPEQIPIDSWVALANALAQDAPSAN